MTTRLIFKILSAEDWAKAQASNDVVAPVDIADGYVHFSTAEQVQATLDKWFVGTSDAILIAFDAADFGNTLKWEAARGGDLFPHVYARVCADLAKEVWSMGVGANGAPVAPVAALEFSLP